MIKKPIFIIGAERSGTTMLQLMINGHSNIAIPYESSFIIHYYHKLEEFGDLTVQKNKYNLVSKILSFREVSKWNKTVEAESLELRGVTDYSGIIDLVFSEYARLHGKCRWGDKTPGYTPHIDIINKLFPDCQFIHIIRDGRDVALSLKKLWGSNSIIKNLEYWKETVVLAHKMGNMLDPTKYLEVKYEELVLNPQAVLEIVCQFLGEKYENEMINFQHRSKDVVGHLSVTHQNLFEPVNKSHIFKWKREMPNIDKCVCDSVTGSVLEEFGYERWHINHPLMILRKIYINIQEGLEWRLNTSMRKKGKLRRLQQLSSYSDK
ncbi:MAG: sulfotransferase [Candidatus Scalindua sp.]|jgi:hypothetical protein|nr:sulfotransferase [Candidatus Scalindua sp.]MBT6227968.1 sulfotransferase [Candidatus Scalindua sp.]MBT6561716.1 sulfotransferase [Candidatus Scalindua sp.]MBT7211118.1 sulfotransferase [Candidatus Scalindua sp.]